MKKRIWDTKMNFEASFTNVEPPKQNILNSWYDRF